MSSKTLEKIRAIKPKYIFCNGGGVLLKEEEAIKALDANIDVIHALHDQIVDYINQGMHITEIIHAVKIPKHLENSPYLSRIYSRVEFFVYNVYRWYHGYFDDNPAHLLPRPEKEVLNEIYNLIGNPITKRSGLIIGFSILTIGTIIIILILVYS